MVLRTDCCYKTKQDYLRVRTLESLIKSEVIILHFNCHVLYIVYHCVVDLFMDDSNHTKKKLGNLRIE
jgi:hypothetical protein